MNMRFAGQIDKLVRASEYCRCRTVTQDAGDTISAQPTTGCPAACSPRSGPATAGRRLCGSGCTAIASIGGSSPRWERLRGVRAIVDVKLLADPDKPVSAVRAAANYWSELYRMADAAEALGA